MMSRLQKKCFMGATGVHLLLVLALFVGPGFFTKEKPDNSPILEFITDKATDDETKDPGKAGSLPPAVAVPIKQPVQQQQPAPPTPPQKQVERVEPTRVETQKETKQSPVSHDPVLDKPDKPKIKISDKVVKLSKTNPVADNSAADAAKANADRVKRINEATRRITSGLSSSTEIKLDGPVGNGGAGMANYGQIVRKKYTDAWSVPNDLTDDDAIIKVSVTIARDGTVLSSRIVESTGGKDAVNTIQRALDRVPSIGVPFPDGAKEAQRTFTMTFSLKAKKSLG